MAESNKNNTGVNPESLKWARERWARELWPEMEEKKRSELSLKEAEGIYKKYRSWEDADAKPTLAQAEKIAKKFHIPLAYLYIKDPPKEKLTITDFRSQDERYLKQPSPALIETIGDAQDKQRWYSNYLKNDGNMPFSSFSNISKGSNDDEIAETIRDFLGIEKIDESRNSENDKILKLIKEANNKGIMVIRSGVVKGNTHRPLNPKEFNGFALHDDYAPLIFINGKDYIKSQIFTFAHECAHLALGETGIDSVQLGGPNVTHQQTENRCNHLAGKVLLPTSVLTKDWNKFSKNEESIAKKYNISPFVVLLRALREKLLSKKDCQERWDVRYNQFLEWQQSQNTKKGGKRENYYHNLNYQLGGEPFLHAIIQTALEKKPLYREINQMTGINYRTLIKKAEKIGYQV